MAQSTELTEYDDILYSQYNNLRKDVLDPGLGHAHTGDADGGYLLVPAGLDADKGTGYSKGRLYYATDTYTLYRGTGTAWEEVAHVRKTGDETIGGVKTFTSIPLLPATDPTLAEQATRKAYVDKFLPLSGGVMTGPITGITTLEADLLQIGGQEVIPPEVSGRLSLHAVEAHKVGIKAHQRDPGGWSDLVFRQLKSDGTWANVMAWHAQDGAEARLYWGRIPVDRLEIGEYAITRTVAAETVYHTLWMASRTLWPFVGTDTTVEDIARCSIGWDTLVSVTTRGHPCTFGLWVATGYAVTFTFGYYYLTSSRPPEIWLQIDNEGKLLSVCSCRTGMDIRPPLELLDRATFLAEVLITPGEYEELERRARGAATTVAMFVHKNVQLSGQTAKVGEFEFKLDLKRREEVRFIRWVSKAVRRLEKRKVPAIELKKIFNEISGQWEEREVPKVELVPETRYRLKDPELGEQSEIEQYQVMVPQLVYEEREVEIEEEIEVEEPI